MMFDGSKKKAAVFAHYCGCLLHTSNEWYWWVVLLIILSLTILLLIIYGIGKFLRYCICWCFNVIFWMLWLQIMGSCSCSHHPPSSCFFFQYLITTSACQIVLASWSWWLDKFTVTPNFFLLVCVLKLWVQRCKSFYMLPLDRTPRIFLFLRDRFAFRFYESFTWKTSES